MEVLKEDTEVLDYVILKLSQENEIWSKDLKSMGFINLDITENEADIYLRKYITIIEETCNIKIPQLGYGSYQCDLDRKIQLFYENGGFSEYFKRQEADKKKKEEISALKEEIEILTAENLRFQNENIPYEKEIKKYKIISLVLGIIVAMFAIAYYTKELAT